MDILRFTIKGRTPLLMHNAASMALETAAGMRKRIPAPEEEAELGAYRLPDGNLGFPAVGVRNSALSGSKGLRINRRAAMPFIAGSMLLLDPLFPLHNSGGEPLKDYAVDVQRAVIKGYGAVMRARPRIDLPWFITARYLYYPLASEKNLIEVITEAGRLVGIGDYRIEKRGPYGAFELESLEIITEYQRKERIDRAEPDAAEHRQAEHS